MKAKFNKRWDTWIINIDGTGEKKLISDATWATWREDGQNIVFARGMDIFTCDINGQNEKKLVDGAKELKEGIAQNPSLSHDGKFMAITSEENREL